ncbi:MAG: response regulator, partial [Chloroflexi bacterium]|nr:response regulator [Chloroflexota bacterium]
TLYFTPAALGYLAQFILALLIAGYFIARLLPRRADRPAHRVLLTAFFACITLLTLLLILEAALPSGERWYAVILQAPVLFLGIILLQQFAYRFPERLHPKWEAWLVLAFNLRFILEEVTTAIYRFERLTWGQVRFRGAEMDYPIALGLLWAGVVVLRQSLAASARQRAGDAGRGGVTPPLPTPPLQRLLHALWRPFRDLWRPQGQAARTARALMLVYLLPFGISLLTILRSYYGIPQELLQLSRSLGIMLALAAFAIVYLNHLPETTSFMVRLVGATLVTLLTVLAAVGWLVTPAYAAQYRPVFPDQRTLRFTPNAAGGYDLSLASFRFERDLGASFIKPPVLDAAGRSFVESQAQHDFVFPFFGHTYDRVYANLDGTIVLGHTVPSYSDYSYHYGSIPLLMPLLLDLAPEETGRGDAFVRQEADRLIVTWQRVPAFYRREAVFTFQAILYRSGVFEFSYDGLPAALPYRPDDEPSANVWAIGATPGDPSTRSGQAVTRSPRRIALADLIQGSTNIISSGSAGLVQDYYLDFREHLHTLLLPLAYLILGSSLLMLLAFPWLFRLNLVKPLETLLAGVRRVNAGDLQAAMPIYFRDEIGFLTASFNSTVAKLRDLVATLETRVAERTADLTQVNARLRQEIDQREATQAQLLVQQRALAAAEERERLGRELHDGLGQVMGYINVQSQAVQTLLAEGQTAAAQTNLHQMTQAAQDAHADIRNYILGLRLPATAPGDLRQTLETYLRQFTEQYGIQATLSYPADPPCAPFAPAVEEQVIRIVQEALTNVRKHAGATRVEVLFSFTGEQAQVIISDDGGGFRISDLGLRNDESPAEIPLHSVPGAIVRNPAALDASSPQSAIGNHFGLSIMRERAAQVGGRLEVRSTSGQGTRVLLTLPCSASMPDDKDETREMRVLLVDDHPLFLDGLRNLLVARGVNVIGLARDGLEAQERAIALRPNLIVMDLEMPRCNGLEAVRAIKAQLPEIKIVMLTVSESEGDLFEAIKSGASGYLLKSLDAGEFVKLLAGVMRGEAPLPPALAARLVAEWAHSLPPRRGDERGVPADLPPRQWEILQLVARGMTYKEAGAALHLSEEGVKYHMGRILELLHLANREQAVAYARRHGDKVTR